MRYEKEHEFFDCVRGSQDRLLLKPEVGNLFGMHNQEGMLIL